LITDIDQRKGWPDELKTLLQRYPRDTWKTQATPMTRFWLDKHDYFRQQSHALSQQGVEFRAARVTAVEFGTWLAPRLQSFLGALHGHHQIEDFHYFPAFREADQGLAPGFDVLASDHELLHRGIVDIVNKTNTLLGTLNDDSAIGHSAQQQAGESYVETSELVFQRLLRHLDDEEDLIIPIMLERG
jgi:iron-sulfur cluster repair protein YtfE (RIC family)